MKIKLKVMAFLLSLTVLLGAGCSLSDENHILNVSQSEKNSSFFHSDMVENDGIECITCNGNGECILCKGSGVCGYCDGEKKRLCDTCLGSDICMNCGADGDVDGRTCVICKGTGNCYSCLYGYKQCYQCYNTGSCYECDGNGTCITCQGTGKFDETKSYTTYTVSRCTDCKGTGNKECNECEDGACNVCEGSGSDACYMCNGSGICPYCDGNPSEKSNYSKRCWNCGTSGKCKKCDNGKRKCTTCGGTGICKECHGVYSVECPKCSHGYYYEQLIVSKNVPTEHISNNDNYDNSDDYLSNSEDGWCSYCSGLGYKNCPDCVTGKCIECSGDGYIKERVFGGDDKIKKIKCFYCNGSGKCRTCGGKVDIVCPYCS